MMIVAPCSVVLLALDDKFVDACLANNDIVALKHKIAWLGNSLSLLDCLNALSL
jgi:hypothetical protein